MSNTLKLFRITLDLNNYCNYNCSYCSDGYLTQTNPISLPITYIEHLLQHINKYLHEYSIFWVIQGGEPLLYKELNNVLNMIYCFGNTYYIKLLSNGSLNMNFIEIKSKDTSKFDIRISLHYEPMLRLGYDKQFNILYNNVEYFLANNYYCHVKIIKYRDMTDRFINEVFDKFKILSTKYNINYEIPYLFNIILGDNKDTYENEIDTNIYIYIYRGIYINPMYRYKYQCPIAKNSSKSLLSKVSWQILRENINKQMICNFTECVCKTCFHVNNEGVLL